MSSQCPPDARSLFWFGISLSGVCLAAAGIAAWRGLGAGWVWAAASVGAVLLLASVFVPAVRLPLYRGFRRVTYPVHVVVMIAWLGAVFYLLVTPLGLLLRLRGRDTMMRAAATRRRGSYWQQRATRSEPSRYGKTF